MLIAHRGASGYYPENTLAAFRGALRLGCSSLECDVRRTADGVLVLMHDPDLRRIGHTDANVRDLSYRELSLADAGSWFDPRFSAERVPRFQDLLSLLTLSAELHVDIKENGGCEGGILEAVRFMKDWTKRTTFSSSDPDLLCRVRALGEDLRLGFQPRTMPLEPALRTARELGAESLRLRRDRLSEEWVERAHRGGMAVYAYTVNTRAELDRLALRGVDRVFTNFPDLRSGSSLDFKEEDSEAHPATG